jgi:hypothetical protein
VALTTPVVDLFTDEWARFTAGLEQLDPGSAASYEQAYKRRKRNPDGTVAINIPGWSDIWHGAAHVAPLPENVTEYYAAKREHRSPNINGADLQEIQRRETIKDRIAQSAQPDYINAMGSVLTAIDNVQDFMTTVAVAGKVSLWGLGKVVQAILPGASEGTATALAEVAARRAAAEAAATFAGEVAARAAAGELVAKLALNNPALMAAARAEAIRLAERTAFEAVFSRAALGVGARLVGRFIPVLGWVLLASDVLNLLSLLGMLATPAYALACQGGQQAMLAGVPAAMFKRALKSETWTQHNLNPFAREARATRALRAGRLVPSVSNLIEVVQTTDSLFGVGASFGGLVGMLQESLFGLDAYSRGESVAINLPGAAQPVSADARKKFAALPRRDQRVVLQAGQIATGAGAVWRVQEVFTEEEHVLTAIAYMEAIAVLWWFWHDLDWQESAAQLADRQISPPFNVTEETRLWAESRGLDLAAHARWWFAGAPATVTGREYVESHARAIPPALREFLAPRRRTITGALYGALVVQTTDYLYMLLENDAEFFKWSLTPDARLVSSFVESGWLLPNTADESAVWQMWQAARAQLAATGATSVTTDQWARLAQDAGVPLIRQLPPEAAVPAAFLAAAGEVHPPA